MEGAVVVVRRLHASSWYTLIGKMLEHVEALDLLP